MVWEEDQPTKKFPSNVVNETENHFRFHPLPRDNVSLLSFYHFLSLVTSFSESDGLEQKLGRNIY